MDGLKLSVQGRDDTKRAREGKDIYVMKRRKHNYNVNIPLQPAMVGSIEPGFVRLDTVSDHATL